MRARSLKIVILLGLEVSTLGCSARKGQELSWDANSPPENFEAAVRFAVGTHLRPWSQVTPEWVSVRITDGAVSYTLQGRDFRSTENWGAPRSPWYETRTEGMLRTSVVFRLPGGDTLAVGEVALPLTPGTGWSVHAFIWRHNPAVPPGPCFGCEGEQRFPVRAVSGTTEADSLHVRWIDLEIGDKAPLVM